MVFSVSVISTVILFLESDTKTEIKKKKIKNKTLKKPTTKTSKQWKKLTLICPLPHFQMHRKDRKTFKSHSPSETKQNIATTIVKDQKENCQAISRD